VLTEEAENIIRQWRSGQKEFPVSSSGTTGEPGIFLLKRNLIELSCRITGEALSINPEDRIHCCLPLTKVGGLMQLFRAEIWGVPIDVIEPTANPLLHYEGTATIISLTPMQLSHIWANENSRKSLLKFRVVLLGGAGLSASLEKEIAGFEKPVFYHTYGMTETYSHVALRRIGEQGFRFLLPTKASLSNIGCLQFSNAITENRVMKTTDVAIIATDGSFSITGRVDNVINSGGIKIAAESVETLIQKHFGLAEGTFFCAGIPDEILGEKLVLVIQKGISAPDLEKIPFEPSYLRPKEVMTADTFLLTETHKIRRKETLALICKQRAKHGNPGA
jgi:O-succinylbenzoic acid--CoA ligase